MSADSFPDDVVLSHSAKDKAVVRPRAERWRQHGRFEFGTRNSEFEIPRLCMSANALGSDRARLACPPKPGGRRRDDALNENLSSEARWAKEERRFIPLRFDAHRRKHGKRNFPDQSTP